MLIFHHGHSEFLLELADGYRILTDPFDAHVGCPMRRVRCDAVTVSHAHSDHSEVGKAENYTALVEHAGTTVLAPGVGSRALKAGTMINRARCAGPTASIFWRPTACASRIWAIWARGTTRWPSA